MSLVESNRNTKFRSKGYELILRCLKHYMALSLNVKNILFERHTKLCLRKYLEKYTIAFLS